MEIGGKLLKEAGELEVRREDQMGNDGGIIIMFLGPTSAVVCKFILLKNQLRLQSSP